VVQGQDELRIMVQIGCRCLMHLQDLFLENVRGFKAQEVPADWHEQLMVVAEEVGGGRTRQTRRQQRSLERPMLKETGAA
jgi:hypothetical protein